MDYVKNEKKWQQIWAESKEHSFDYNRLDKKYYVLEMFSYPSGANLHLGHLYNFGPADSFARYKKMQGYEVYQPMGFDSFGLPAENYAIKTGIHPEDSTLKNIKTMERQLASIGAMFETESSMYTSSPEYYKWTQWLFLLLYKNGLAYQKESPVNWCSSCMTVIANEQVIDGKCERCGHEIVRKNMLQWSFKITDYSQRLLDGLDKIDWPEKTKIMQRNWIGRSEGGEISFSLSDGQTIKVFTTRADTLMGVSYIVLAPEHPFVDIYTTKEYKNKIKEYKESAAKQSEIERLSLNKEKTGQFTGCYCIHPISGEKIPVWIADYCLASYGTGAVMGVPAHDTRDYEFAKKYNLPIKKVIAPLKGEADLPFVEYGILVNSLDYSGLESKTAIKNILNTLSDKGLGKATVNYRLRDWSVSRQRYWGAPIPIIHCEHCGAVPVKEEDLPVLLPYDVNFTPGGKSPLASSENFINVKCPHCGKPAKRDADTLDTFVCSSWYFLRYPDNKNDKNPFNSKLINKMLPVDKYVGGAEHSCMHLLYARFITKALYDLGYINFDEPFTSLVHQGIILGADGEKMSKSKGNVINPDDYTSTYGSDVLRMFLMFSFSYIEGGPWNDNGIKAIAKFLDRIERLFDKVKENCHKEGGNNGKQEVEYAYNYCVKHVRADMEQFSFNTAIARIMELVNTLYLYELSSEVNYKYLFEIIKNLIKIIAPFVPHFAEELHQRAGFDYSVFKESFPDFDEAKLVKQEIEIAIQVNSKIRGKMIIATNLSENDIKDAVLNNASVKELISDSVPKKLIVIPNRLVNIIL